MRERISGTAAYGGLTRGPRVVGAGVRQAMQEVLAEIQSGEFAREWLAEHAAGGAHAAALAAREAQHPIEEVGRRLRALMPRLEGRS